MPNLGIRHVHLIVTEHQRSIDFYRAAFDMTEVFRIGHLALLGTPGSGDSLALHLADSEIERARIGQQGGYEHFGIHVRERSVEAIDEVVRNAEAAGGTLIERGEHGAGLPYAYVADPDGYTIEISGPAGTPPWMTDSQSGA
jgi:catechol 2,3-dioxygenase-like lactoylglutathione lyase family enzyme